MTSQIDLYDDSPTGTPGGRKNWVDKAGGLPGPIRARYRALRRKHPEWTREHCYAVAVNAVKYSRATGDSKLPGKQNQRKSKVAAHTRAANKWDRMTSNHSYEELIEEIQLATTTKKKDDKSSSFKLNIKDKSKDKEKEAGSDKEKETFDPKNKTKKGNDAKKTGKTGAASDGNRNPDDLKKTIKAYKKNKSKLSPEQRKKVEARIKSSKQQLGQKGKM